MVGIGHGLVAGPAAGVAGDDHAAGRRREDLVIVGQHGDDAGDRVGVHGVVVGVDADVVVAADPGLHPPPGGRVDGRQGEHPGPVGLPPLGGAGLQGAVDAPVGDGQPGGQLGVEVAGATERAAGQETRLKVAVGPLDQPLRFWITRTAEVDLRDEQARERGEPRRQPAAADPGLVGIASFSALALSRGGG